MNKQFKSLRRALVGRRASAGFTLIELMVTVAIVGILAAVAYPNYADYLRRGHVSEAPGKLADFRAQMEQYYQDHRNYGKGTVCGVPVPDANGGAKYFDYRCDLADATGQAYSATATGAKGSTKGFTYKVNQRNAQETTCDACAWNFGTQGSWILRKP